MKLLKFHVSSTIAVVGLVVAWETAVDGNKGQGAAGANWYLRGLDGSRQGPYGLSQLGEWSSAGYVSPDSLIQWGPSGAPQSLSSALRADNISGYVAPGAGQPTGGNVASTYGSGFGSAAGAVSEDWGRGGDDDTSEEEQGHGYRGAARQPWSGQGDDSEEDHRSGPPGIARESGGPRDEWGQLMSEGVMAVEGGRWSESIAAAKGTFRKLFNVGKGTNNRRGSSGGGRGRGGRYQQSGLGGRVARGSGRRGPSSSGTQQRRDGNRQGGYGSAPAGYGGRGTAGGGSNWNRGGNGASSAWGRGDDAWTTNTGQSPPPQQQQQHAIPHYQQQVGSSGGTAGGLPIVPGDSAPPPPLRQPSVPDPQPEWQSEQQGHRSVDGGSSAYPPPEVDGSTNAFSPSPPPEGEPPNPDLHAGNLRMPQLPSDAVGGVSGGYPARPPPPPPPSVLGGTMPVGSEGGGVVAEDGGMPPVGTGGLDPKDIAAFYAAQADSGDGGDGAGANGVVAPTRRSWRRRRDDMSKEDLRALGLTYGEPDDGDGGGFRAPGTPGPKGSRGRFPLAGKVSVDSMKLKYAENWMGDDGQEGIMGALKSAAGSSIARISLPGKAVSSTAPVVTLRFVSRAGSFLPLLLWWTLSVSKGVLPVIMAFLASRLLVRLSHATAGFYVYSPEVGRETRLDCLALVGQQVGAGVTLALTTGVIRGWIRPSARERSAALGRRLLAGVCVAGGDDRPYSSEFRELCLSPWAYVCQLMGVTHAVSGVVAAALGLHYVWPVRGPSALGGFAAILVTLEAISLVLARGADVVASQHESSSIEALAGGIQGGKVVSGEAEARGLRQILLDKHSSLLEATQETGRRRTLMVATAVRAAVMWVLMGAAAGYALLAVVEEELAFHFGSARVVLVMAQVWLAHSSLQRLLHCMGELKRLQPAAMRMHAMAKGLDEPRGKTTGLGAEGGWSNDGPEASDGLRLQGVTLTLTGRTMPVLSGVNLHAPAGSVVAILGGSGAGKTALLQVVLGALKPDRGEAAFQGRPLQEWESGAFRERLAWLNQVSARFSLTAGENIGAGDSAEFFNRELWARAAGLSGANAAIESLPLGYDTVLEDNGALAATSGSIDRSGLSEGQWQRLMLSRFLMRADVAKLLVLDEPFKGISPAESSRMMAALGAQARATGQVVLVASQDLSLGRWADATVFLESGRVLEAGAWDDLLTGGGAFAAALVAHDSF